MLFRRARFDTPCTIAIEQSEEHFHAHVELDGDVAIGPGDRVRVHGAPIRVPFGSKVEFRRMATVETAGPIRRALTKLKANFELSELYEVSFTPGRMR